MFLDALKEYGYVVGRNLVYESRYARSEPARLPGLVDELMAGKPDALVGIEQVAQVMKGKTSSIPIVLFNSSDPVAAGLVQSLARPGGKAGAFVSPLLRREPGRRRAGIRRDGEEPAGCTGWGRRLRHAIRSSTVDR